MLYADANFVPQHGKFYLLLNWWYNQSPAETIRTTTRTNVIRFNRSLEGITACSDTHVSTSSGFFPEQQYTFNDIYHGRKGRDQ